MILCHQSPLLGQYSTLFEGGLIVKLSTGYKVLQNQFLALGNQMCGLGQQHYTAGSPDALRQNTV